MIKDRGIPKRGSDFRGFDTVADHQRDLLTGLLSSIFNVVRHQALGRTLDTRRQDRRDGRHQVER